jgi:hypothetical protein
MLDGNDAFGPNQIEIKCDTTPPTRSITRPTSPRFRKWLGHANIATTRIYDHRRTRPEDSPTFKVAY